MKLVVKPKSMVAAGCCRGYRPIAHLTAVSERGK